MFMGPGERDKVWMTEPVEVEILSEEERPAATRTPFPPPTPTKPAWCDPLYKTGRVLHEVLQQNDALFSRQPNFVSVSAGVTLWDPEGEREPIPGIKVIVSEKVDQETLSPEDRIPDCISGVPIQIVEKTPQPGNKRKGMSGDIFK